MPIHHSTLKKAEKLGYTLAECDTSQGPGIEATDAASKTKLTLLGTAAAALDALSLAVMLKVEYKAKLTYNVEDRQFKVQRGKHEQFFDDLPSLEDALEAAGLEPGDGEDEELDDDIEQGAGSVVKAKYRQMYKERGNPKHCSDWLAQTLDGVFDVADDPAKPKRTRFDHEAFADMLAANGVSLTGKWADLPNSGQSGWVGRYRMTGRQKLEMAIAANDVLILNGDKVKPDAGWLAAMKAKHDKRLTAEDRAAAREEAKAKREAEKAARAEAKAKAKAEKAEAKAKANAEKAEAEAASNAAAEPTTEPTTAEKIKAAKRTRKAK